MPISLHHRHDKATQLQRFEVLRGCSPATLRALDRASGLRSIDPGFVLCQEGTVGRQAFLLLEGEAAVEIGGSEVARIGPGGFVGEMALLDHRPRTATVTARTPLTVLVFSVAEFETVLRAAPALARRLTAALSQRLRANNEHLSTTHQ